MHLLVFDCRAVEIDRAQLELVLLELVSNASDAMETGGTLTVGSHPLTVAPGDAGAGVKPGFIYGATDEFGYHAVENRMHIHDLHATLLRLMGLNHEKLTYRYAGRDFRLTDVAGTVAEGIIA